MVNNKYHLSKTKKEKEAVNLEFNKLNGYKVNPKVKEKDGILVNKIVFVDNEFSEKIIRKKIDMKIEYLLKQLKLMQDEGTDNGTIKKSLMDAEKLRVQLINKYVKYLGHTYYGLTLKKIELIIEELNFKLYMKQFYQDRVHYYNSSNEKEGRRGR
jgi:hypothetical protein